MRRHLRNPWVWVVAALLCALWLFWPRPVKSPPLAPPAVPASTPIADARTSPPTAASNVDARAFLPPEALRTLSLIERGGPFPHRQDGSIFGNRESRLPAKPRGYYREYTVDTPGLDHRGTRRIVAGGTPPEVWYYSDDHYDSFRAFAWPPEERR